MFPVHCSECSRKSFSAGTPRCLHCGANLSRRVAIVDNIHTPETIRRNSSTTPCTPAADTSTQTTLEDLIIVSPKEEASSQTTEEEFIHVQNNKRNVSKDREFMDRSVAPKLTAVDDSFNPTEQEARREFVAVSGYRNQLFPNDAQLAEVVRVQDRKICESNYRRIMDKSHGQERSRSKIHGIRGNILPIYSKEGGMNYGILSEMRETRTLEFAESCLDANYKNFPTREIFQPRYQGMQEHGNLKRTFLQNSASNFGNFQISRNEKLQKEISDSGASKAKMTHSVDDILAVPGLSGFHNNMNTSNLWMRKLQSTSSLELQAVEVTDKNPLTCGICKLEIAKHHFEDEGKNYYKCCACKYRSDKKYHLQRHASIHGGNFMPCNICGELIWEKEAHGNEKKCKLCNKNFQCRTLLEQHSLDHEEHYFLHCRVCGKKVSDHNVLEDRSTYKCCKCKINFFDKFHLKIHLYTETCLKLFKCDFCFKRFAQSKCLKQHLYIHFYCEICSKRFPSHQHLDAHYLEKHKTWLDSLV